MAKKPVKRSNWEFRLNDETYRLMIRSIYRTSLVIPRVVSMNQLIGCVCFFIKERTFEELLSIYHVEAHRPMNGDHMVYANGLQPFDEILEATVNQFFERAQIRTFKNHLLLIMMREYVLQLDDDIRAAFDWADSTISGKSL